MEWRRDTGRYDSLAMQQALRLFRRRPVPEDPPFWQKETEPEPVQQAAEGEGGAEPRRWQST